ncbi:Cuedc1p [Dermatophagoides pteronyssinus]|uniref:Cuedc1p n=1 Tax=Dermatophagoides pteronyssinus TaxID=6956 RepID=A0ABQ8JM12_DERPT|nr:Cuedc1p [Dermatophagoides pteronyssinus]
MYPSNSSSTASSSGVTQLEFNQAMSDFKHMFPDMEEDIIEAILRANNGVVDTTIDQLLQINNETQEKKKRNKAVAAINNNEQHHQYNSNIFIDDGHLAAKTSNKDLNFHHHHPNNDQIDATSMSNSLLSSSLKNHRIISSDSLRYKYHWEPPLLGELSKDFLRIQLNETQRKLTNFNVNNEHTNLISSSFLQQKMEQNKRNRQITSMNDDPEMAQYLEDERFAILLQNEEFVRELRMNQDFMSTLDADNNSSGGHYSGSSIPSSNTTAGGVADLTQASNFLDSDAIFKERLRNMGKLSKKKFTQIARLFSGRMRKNFKQLDNGGSGGSGGTISTGTNRENQYFYQDLNNENYEDTTALPSSSSSTSTNNDHQQHNHQQQQHHNHHQHHHHHHHNHQDHSKI